MGAFDFLGGGVGDMLGGLISGIGQAAAAKTAAAAQEQINQANLAEQQREFGISGTRADTQFAAQQALAQQQLGLQTQQASGGFMSPQAQNIVAASKILGVNPITLAGGLGGGGSSFSASVGGGGPSGGSPGLSSSAGGGTLGNVLKGLGQGLSDAAPESVSRIDQLKEQLLGLQVDSLKGDVIHKDLINSALALKIQPGRVQGNGVPLPSADPRYEPDIKPGLQRFQTTSGVVVGPSRALQESAFSSIPGLPMSAIVARDAANQIPIPSFRPDAARVLESPSVSTGGDADFSRGMMQSDPYYFPGL